MTACGPSAQGRLANLLDRKLPWLFLVYALPAIVVFSIVTPPFQVADEPAHIERADELSRGSLISKPIGGIVDGDWEAISSLYEWMHFHSDVKQTTPLARETVRIHWSGPKVVNFQNTAQYGPFMYIPQAIAVRIARIAGIGLVHTLMAARVLNGFAACSIGFFALSICRRGRALMFSTLLLPMTLSEFGSASQDALLISLSLLIVAVTSRVVAEERTASTSEFALFASVVVATTIARPSQIALALLSPALLRRRDPKWRTKALVGVVAALAVIGWIPILANLIPPLAPELSPPRQIHSLLTHPLLLPSAMINYFRTNDAWFPMTVIGYLGWTDAILPIWYYFVAGGILLLALVAPQNRGRALWPGMLALITFAALLTILSAALFVSWTAVGLVTISGMQGRYLLPVLPLLAWPIPEYRPCTERLLMATWYPVLLFPLLTLIVTPTAIMTRYYGSWGAMADSVTLFLRP